MKILIEKTSDWEYEEIREYESLEACIEELLGNKELFPDGGPEVVVSKLNDRRTFYKEQGCEYIVEIYNTWRE